MHKLTEGTSLLVQLLDYPLGRLLFLPRDVTLVIVALLTVALLTSVRRFATNQDQLRRCAADLRRLRSLRREARQRNDQAALVRLAQTRNAVRWLLFRADLRVLAIAIVPLALLATWAIDRLDYLPAQASDEHQLTAYYPLSSIDRLTHLVPRPDIQLLSPPVQTIVVDDIELRQARATWRFRAVRESQITLIVRHAGESAQHRLRVGGELYDPPIVDHRANHNLLRTVVPLERYKFLGLDPHLERFGLPPWLVAYLVLTIALTPLLRFAARVA